MPKAMLEYAELLTKSCFSFLRGASHPEELVQTAKLLNYRGMALTDLNGFYGMCRAYEESKKYPDLRLSYGCELLVEGSPLILIAKNLTGYRQICRFLSTGFERSQKKSIPQLSKEDLEKGINPEHLFILIPPRNFPSPSFFEWLNERFPLFQFVSFIHHPDVDEPMKKWLAGPAKDLPKVWTFDVHFHHPSRHEIYEVLQAIREVRPLSQCLPSPNGENHMKPLSVLSKIPREWLKNGIEISEACSFSPSEIRYHYPQEWLPSGKTAYEYLLELCKEGLQKRYPFGAPIDVLSQLQHELEIVQEMQFEDYFLTVWDIVKYARSKKILCQGRGSAANSIICYLLEVTSIDPVQMNLLFERFITRERNEAPDIDVDFEHERREEVIQYVYQKYGRHRAGMVATLITYRTKSALRDVGKALEVPLVTIEDFCKRNSWREKVLVDQEDPELDRWIRIAKTIKGFPRHIGQHTGGMILTADRLDEISPIEPATMENRTVVQWDKYDIEKLGLLKIDLLSLGMLTCLRKSFDLIEENYGKRLELHTLPQDDPKTYQMIQESRTVGVFQIESRAQMTMLPRLKPENFYDLVIEVAIIRPGPIQGGMIHPYLRRRAGLEKVSFEHPKLEPILKRTLGVPIFQEQVMKMAIEVAGYTPGEADQLRRAMGAWKKSGNLESHAQEMCRRLIAQNIRPEYAERICNQILGFGEYGFPESHSASFALLTYASSYLKAHYPEVFLCSLLNSMPMGFYPMNMLTSAFKRDGAQILPVHTEFSNWDHRMEKTGEEAMALRLGFRCVKNLQKDHVEKFMEKRKAGEIDLYIFNEEERASIAMASDLDQKREAYWKALNPHRNSIKINDDAKTKIPLPSLNPLESMLLDLEFTQTTLKNHPAVILKRDRWRYPFSKDQLSLAHKLTEFSPGSSTKRNVLVFGVVQIVQSPPTANGMFFITLEDETGYLNLVLRPNIYQRFKYLIQREWALLVYGELQRAGGYASILVKQVIAPETQQKGSLAGRIRPTLSNEEIKEVLPKRLFY